jgi:hypothetical protein
MYIGSVSLSRRGEYYHRRSARVLTHAEHMQYKSCKARHIMLMLLLYKSRTVLGFGNQNTPPHKDTKDTIRGRLSVYFVSFAAITPSFHRPAEQAVVCDFTLHALALFF